MNSQYFSKEQIQAGEMQKLLDFLMSEAYGAGKLYNDLHIYPSDCEAFIVEWEQIPWSHEYGGSFKYIDEEHVVMLEKQLPDRSYGLFYDEENYNEMLKEWLKEHPGWVKTEYGMWTNEIENKKFQEELENQEAEPVIHENTESNETEVYYENGMPQN